MLAHHDADAFCHPRHAGKLYLVKQKLRDELTTAMKSGDKLRTMVLRGVLAEVSRFEVEKDVRREADEAAIVQILKREKARREETLEFARKGNRQDLVDQNEAELKIIEGYLPAGIGSDELRAAIKEGIAGGATQIGPLMKSLRDKFGARLDGKMASESSSRNSRRNRPNPHPLPFREGEQKLENFPHAWTKTLGCLSSPPSLKGRG